MVFQKHHETWVSCETDCLTVNFSKPFLKLPATLGTNSLSNLNCLRTQHVTNMSLGFGDSTTYFEFAIWSNKELCAPCIKKKVMQWCFSSVFMRTNCLYPEVNRCYSEKSLHNKRAKLCNRFQLCEY